MIILGIEEDHNATACIMREGKIVAAISKERLTRKKNDAGYPKCAVDACLKLANINLDKIDKVAVSTIDQNIFWFKIEKRSGFSVQDHVIEQHEYFKPLLIEKKPEQELTWNYIESVEKRKGAVETEYDFQLLNKNNFMEPESLRRLRINAIKSHLNIDEKKIVFVEHHKCHAYYAYYSSPFRDSETLILTADGVGDNANATVSVVKNNNIERIFATNNCQLARIYRYITLLLGMKPFEHEYKVMGLAPYSNTKELNRAYKVFAELMRINGLEFEWNKKPKDLYFHFRETLEGCRFDGIAGALQKMIETVFLQWVKNAVDKTGIKRVVFAGGLAMNIKLNMAIANLPEVEEFFVSASPADESNAMGACYYVMDEHCKVANINKNEVKKLDDVYLGLEFSEEEVMTAVSKYKERYEIKRGITNKHIAELLAQGKVIGICRGRMEFGARALGNRSILANPSDVSIIRKINSQIKFRDFWMPFTPSILFERINDYIINPKNIYSPYMTIGFNTTKLAQSELIAALHPADLTARPQMVKKDTNPLYHDLIREFEKITGIGAVLNTSLNLHGLPIVCSPLDAIEVMEKSQLDMMYFGDVLLSRRE